MSLFLHLGNTAQPPVSVRVGGEQFVTSLATLRKQPQSLLAAMFDEPWPLREPFTNVHIVPQELVAAAAFSVILDYLRSDGWLPMVSKRLYDAVDDGCKALGLRVHLPPPPPEEFAPCQVAIETVVLERPPTRGMFTVHPAVTDLGRRGYRVVREIPSEFARHCTGTPVDTRCNRFYWETAPSVTTLVKARESQPVALVMQRVAPQRDSVAAVVAVEPRETSWLRLLSRC
jgi:hypothetical protein